MSSKRKPGNQTFGNMIVINGKQVDYKSIEVDGIDHYDYPKFCDAYATKANFMDGTELTDEEVEQIDPQTVYERVMDILY